MLSSPQSCNQQRFDDQIEQLYDKILEDEDKILIAEKRKLGGYSSQSSDSLGVLVSSDESLLESDDFQDLQTFNQDEFLNESTADFNKEIK
jgi:hypothetical protein